MVRTECRAVLTAGYGEKCGRQLEQQAGHESDHGSDPAAVGQGADEQADQDDIARAELPGEDQGLRVLQRVLASTSQSGTNGTPDNPVMRSLIAYDDCP